MPRQEPEIKLDELSCAALGAESVNFSWSEGYGDTWDTIVPDANDLTLAQCRDLLDEAGRDLPDPNPWDMTKAELRGLCADEDGEVPVGPTKDFFLQHVVARLDDEEIDGIEAWREAVREMFNENPDRFQPMMNYYYPLPAYDDERAEADQLLLDQNHVACVLARVGDEVVLALSGGGMDLSWDICYSYMLLGYLPPIHFCELPRFAGQQPTPRNRAILDACLRSTRSAARQVAALGRELRAYKKELGAPAGSR